jgi:hypothetical protein
MIHYGKKFLKINSILPNINNIKKIIEYVQQQQPLNSI